MRSLLALRRPTPKKFSVAAIVEPVRAGFGPFHHRHRQPDFRRVDKLSAFETLRRDADDAKLVIVDEHVFADESRIAAKAPLPRVVAKNDDRMRQFGVLSSSGRKVRPWIAFTLRTSK